MTTLKTLTDSDKIEDYKPCYDAAAATAALHTLPPFLTLLF